MDYSPTTHPTGDHRHIEPAFGMTLRQHYAAQALPGLIQGYAVAYGSPTKHIGEICAEAFNFADEMLAAEKA
jgi:hypothetical protein